MPLRMFCVALAVVLSINALIFYLLSHSIRAVIVNTLASSLIFQVGYFASVLFLIWRSGRPAQLDKHFDAGKVSRRQLPPCRKDEK
ncbi:exopolysaccharide production repressor protein [Mesorhizobium argentiipisi]|uniref:Exopolysaccharide production repressor protein exox n=1 Tax=Mesorhizobium argentiipisi TaxID=3015175 RepID=A0ABU8K802_9HYPH